jgi:hypothetical protein
MSITPEDPTVTAERKTRLAALLVDQLTRAGMDRHHAIEALAQAWHMGWQAGWADAADGGLTTEPFPDSQRPA